MVSIGFLRRFLFAALPAWGKEKANKAAFRRLLRELRADRAGIYDPILNRLSKSFAEGLADLEAIAGKLLPVYKATIAGNDADARTSELDVIRSMLRGAGLELASFAFDTLKDEVFAKGAKSVDDIDDAFKARLAIFEGAGFKEISTGLGTNRRIAALCEFDFTSILEPFKIGGAGRAELGSCHAGLVAENLLDLYFLLCNLKPDAGTAAVLSALTESVAVQGDGFEQSSADLRGLSELLGGKLEPERLGAIIRCIQGNPGLELRSADDDARGLDRIVTTLKEEFGKKRREFVEIQERKDFDRKMHFLFGDVPLVPLEGYTQESSVILSDGGLIGYKYVLPMRILKSFLTLHFRAFVAPAVSALSVEADIIDKEFKIAIGDGVEAVNTVALAVAKFEEDMTVAAYSKSGTIVDQVSKGLLDASVKAKARRMIDEINASADRIIQSAFSRLSALRETLARLATDIRASSPALVLNAHYLVSLKPELVKGLLKSGHLVDSAIGLLRLFAVDLGKARKNLRPTDPPAIGT
jgi:hypothetical protein